MTGSEGKVDLIKETCKLIPRMTKGYERRRKRLRADYKKLIHVTSGIPTNSNF